MPWQPPDTIYLQSNSLYEVWDVGKMDSDDVEYIRADVHRGLIADLLAACKELIRYYSIPASATYPAEGQRLAAHTMANLAIAKVEDVP